MPNLFRSHWQHLLVWCLLWPGPPAEKPKKLWPSWPASSPWVTAVGSTRFIGQKVGAEEMATDLFGSGGGSSSMFDIAKDAQWQTDAVSNYLTVAKHLPPSFPRGGRATPDVAALGEQFRVIINGDVKSVSGTPASTPAFAGIISLMNEARAQKKMQPLWFPNPWLYQNADAFVDITKGNSAIGKGNQALPGPSFATQWSASHQSSCQNQWSASHRSV